MRNYTACKLSVFLFFLTTGVFAQPDSITSRNNKLVTSALHEGKTSYAVFFTDSLGNRISTADLWDRETLLDQSSKVYHFTWHWYKADTLLMKATATCSLPGLAPVQYAIERKGKKKVLIDYTGNTATVRSVSRKTSQDTVFNVKVGMPAFAFPMDMEILSALPFKKIGQKFIIPFYEPGREKADWYPCTVTGLEDLPLPAQQSVRCWVIKLDYNIPGASATFWIAQKSHELLKMKSGFKGNYRYKVKLY